MSLKQFSLMMSTAIVSSPRENYASDPCQFDGKMGLCGVFTRSLEEREDMETSELSTNESLNLSGLPKKV